MDISCVIRLVNLIILRGDDFLRLDYSPRKSIMWKIRITAIIILIFGLALGYFVYGSTGAKFLGNIGVPSFFHKFPFKLGLDLSGGTHLVYSADIKALKVGEVTDAMNSLRDVIERRVNLFGVSEPIVQLQQGGIGTGNDQRLIVDLPGVTDINKAVAMIGQTPMLEFKIERPAGAEKDAMVKKLEEAQNLQKEGKPITFAVEDPYYVSTELTGRFLERATLEFDQTTYESVVSLQFNKEGSDLFEKITKENISKTVAIYLDGSPISTPVVREAISGGKAQITGNFSPKEAKALVGRLNSGALPVPIELISTQTVSATLGASAATAGVNAAMMGLLIVAIFLIFWYRLPGVIAVLSLLIYITIMLTLFKLIPVTLTAAGIAGFIISIGLAVDANVLIFERLKEEIKAGRNIHDATRSGFERAWFSIRDSNTSSIITAIILFWFGTSLIKGFALTLGMGVLVSMLSAITISRIFLYAINVSSEGKVAKFLFSSGISK